MCQVRVDDGASRTLDERRQRPRGVHVNAVEHVSGVLQSLWYTSSQRYIRHAGTLNC